MIKNFRIKLAEKGANKNIIFLQINLKAILKYRGGGIYVKNI